MTAIKAVLGPVADWVLHQQPVQSAGALAAVVLGVLAYFGFQSNSQTTQIVGVAVAVIFPVFTHWLGHLAAYSPATHAAQVHAAMDNPSNQRSLG